MDSDAYLEIRRSIRPVPHTSVMITPAMSWSAEALIADLECGSEPLMPSFGHASPSICTLDADMNRSKTRDMRREDHGGRATTATARFPVRDWMSGMLRVKYCSDRDLSRCSCDRITIRDSGVMAVIEAGKKSLQWNPR